ncbi:ribosomal RNA large subunit methyltransferase F [Marinobacterium nitratireducens]|uniref:Ribosomal RNA large subunit methyltransferase F n=1 Tax=Marinobacterium nitratireducens TaxID=518897 RepID=A0A917ZGL2_9GAMM|nr:23S rRNA (adenine(1618)-N(6))-methyltransferase RlmF [Marinobacterium nitratireducens]GGO81684.1 ribosomal RNA large subunit methyltransferase F [Marinobacterium nitratireducens]
MSKTDALRNAKSELHPRNRHQARYDFVALTGSSPELKPFVRPNRFGNDSIDFSDPEALKALNAALLKYFYGVAFWDLPPGFLCPPIPGRADYVHYLADLLAESNGGIIPRGRSVRALDIGIGANCIYPIVGTREYGWRFVGSDINPVAIATAQTIIAANTCLSGNIEARLQKQPQHIFEGIWRAHERFDITLCNPPFHASEEAMAAEANRKWQGLKKRRTAASPRLNFGGQANELWCDGGEEEFVCRMVRESRTFGERCCWFTSLVAKQASLKAIHDELKKAGAVQVRTIKMAQGQKISRFVAWSFLTAEQQAGWRAA